MTLLDGPRKEEVGDVGRGQKEREPGDTHEEGGEPQNTGADVSRHQPGGRERYFEVLVDAGKLLPQSLSDGRERSAGFVEANAIGEPALDEDDIRLAIVEVTLATVNRGLHRHRKKDIGGGDYLRSVEGASGNSDDGIGSTVEYDVLADDVGLASEPALPRPVAQDRDRMLSRFAIVLAGEGPAECGLDTQYLEVVPRDEVAPRSLGEAVVREAQGRETVRDETVEDLRPVAEVFVVRVGEHREHALMSAFREGHEPLGRGDGKRTEQSRVQERENSGRRSDSETERKDADEGEGRPVPERPGRLPQVEEEALDGDEPEGVPAGLEEPHPAPELTLRRPPRLIRCVARGELLFDLQRDVETHLLLELAVESAFVDVVEESSPQLRQAHRGSPSAGRMRRWIASMTRSKSAVSRWSAFRPDRVSR